MTGTVKFFNIQKGFGFITSDDNQEVFFHATNVQGEVHDGDKVTFELGEGKKGPAAINVKKA